MLNRKMLIQLENSIFESLKKRVNAKIQFFKVCTDLRKSKRAVGKMMTALTILLCLVTVTTKLKILIDERKNTLF